MELSDTEKKLLDEVVERLRKELGATEALLYGSAARGELDEYSDIDLFVVLPEVNWEVEKQVAGYCFDVELRCDRIFSAICFTRHELEHTPLRSSPFVLNARRDGINL